MGVAVAAMNVVPQATAGSSATSRGVVGVQRTLAYHRSLDGLRAVAVGAVVAGHAGIGVAGSLGVTAFFVISGYLITGLLMAEHESRGTIDIRGFYRRRCARLAPALLTVSLVTVLWVGYIGLAPRRWLAGLIGSLTYTTDFIESSPWQGNISSYFEWSWSLSIEEQYYLVWPMIIALAVRRGRQSGRTALILICGCTIIAAWASRAGMVLHHATSQRITFSFDSHMDALALGSLLAILLAGRRFEPLARRRAGLAAVLAGGLYVLTLGSAALRQHFFPWDAHGLGTVALVSAVLVGGLVIAPSGLAARVLSWSPLVHVGRLSYGLYLWNMLYMNAFNQVFHRKPAAAGWLGIVWVFALFLTCEASYRCIENPLRERFSHRADHVGRESSHGRELKRYPAPNDARPAG